MRFLLSILLCLITLFAHADDDSLIRIRAAASFDETRDALRLAIENRGLVVNYVSHIAEMLERTGADIGATRRIYENGEIIEFCSASLSRRMMERDPQHIVLCPFAIAIYTLPGESGTWLSYRRPPKSAAAIVEPLLQALVREASE